MVSLFNDLLDRIRQFGEIDLHAGKYDITIRRLSTFLSILIEKDHMTLVFISAQPIDEFPVYQNYHRSANRWSNAVKIESPEELDEQLMQWLREAYGLALEGREEGQEGKRAEGQEGKD